MLPCAIEGLILANGYENAKFTTTQYKGLHRGISRNEERGAENAHVKHVTILAMPIFSGKWNFSSISYHEGGTD